MGQPNALKYEGHIGLPPIAWACTCHTVQINTLDNYRYEATFMVAVVVAGRGNIKGLESDPKTPDAEEQRSRVTIDESNTCRLSRFILTSFSLIAMPIRAKTTVSQAMCRTRFILSCFEEDGMSLSISVFLPLLGMKLLSLFKVPLLKGAVEASLPFSYVSVTDKSIGQTGKPHNMSESLLGCLQKEICGFHHQKPIRRNGLGGSAFQLSGRSLHR